MDKLQLILIFYDLLFYIESALRRLQLQCVSWMLRTDGLNGLKSSECSLPHPLHEKLTFSPNEE